MAVYAAFTLVCAALLFGGIKLAMGLRVDAEEEREGLDPGEHGMHAYDFGRGGAQVGFAASVQEEAAAPELATSTSVAT